MTGRRQDRGEFYRLRDLRTITLGGSATALERTVGLVVAEATANCRAGQVAVLALANMMARAHRSFAIEIPGSSPLIARCPFARNVSLFEAILATVAAINPFARLELRAPTSDEPSLAVGRAVGSICLATKGATAFVASEPADLVGDGGAAILGAALASCLGAAELFKLSHGLPVRPTAVSAWDFLPTQRSSGPTKLEPVNVGSVVVVGAGAVGSALAYWVNELGYSGDWTFVDGDRAMLHNTNRSLTFSAADAGWPWGVAGRKADVVAAVLNARSLSVWYDDWVRAEPRATPDLIIPLANERGVRQAINQRGLPIILHSTTSPAWQAQFHRHIAGTDECLACRFPPENAPTFGCAEGPVSANPDHAIDEDSGDAALPFLSAAAGLLLTVGLLRLADGTLVRSPNNFWWLNFDDSTRAIRAATGTCRANCASPSKELVRDVSLGSRWAHLVA